ncbi:MAG: maleylpyruvate isomerase family mycothiol-dependent enzyme [Actinomycetia bacterium]|nr:maleylpyruvate isomerase family mycothiol-dependent enzyme [Actinomycetes bacterium]
MAKSLASQASLPHDLDAVRDGLLNATQSLLGSTIALDEDDWHRPSRLPGWTRAHVATHLARGADALVDLIEGVRRGQSAPLYGDGLSRWEDIERGAQRSALDIQTDLDASAGRLLDEFSRLADLAGTPVILWPGQPVRADLVPLARLAELILHHLDLDCGFDSNQIGGACATWLLKWTTFWLAGDTRYPAVELVAASGTRARIGSGHHRVKAVAADADLLCWLTGRAHPTSFGAQHLPVLPVYS